MPRRECPESVKIKSKFVHADYARYQRFEVARQKAQELAKEPGIEKYVSPHLREKRS